MIQVAHCLSNLGPWSGGPAQVVPALAAALASRADCSVILLTEGSPRNSLVTSLRQSLVDWRLASRQTALGMKTGLPFRTLLNKVVHEKPPAILHDHGIWMPSNHHVAAAARKFGITLVIHTHGMLDPWALEHRAWKKRLALKMYERRDLASVSLFFATSQQEANSIRKLGLRQPIAIIPNGIDLPAVGNEVLCCEQMRAKALRTALFLGRIHPGKGLRNLLDAWARVKPQGWHLRLAGPDRNNHLTEVIRRVEALGLSGCVEYVGAVDGDEKAALFAEADLFVLPSFSESFGIVVVEALAHGVPVIATHGSPWKELETRGCGWWVEPTVDGLTYALREAVGLDHSVRHQMGSNGRVFARSFDCDDIARETADVYRWLLGQGSRPGCVIVN